MWLGMSAAVFACFYKLVFPLKGFSMFGKLLCTKISNIKFGSEISLTIKTTKQIYLIVFSIKDVVFVAVMCMVVFLYL